MKITLLLIVLALLLAACATPTEPAHEPATTEAETTTELTTTQEQTTAFVYTYLTEAEIDEIFVSAWNMYGIAVYGPSLNISDTDIEHDGCTWRFATDPRFNSEEELLAAMHEYFSPQLVEAYMSYHDFPIRMNHPDGLLHRCFGGRGSSGIAIDQIRIVGQTATQNTYELQLRMMWDDSLERHILTRELINDHWVFTQFHYPW